jgi:hypothetical protein
MAVVCGQQKFRMSQFEQWEHLKFCQKLGRSTSETFQMIKQAYSEETLSHSAVFKWYKHSAQGRQFGR